MKRFLHNKILLAALVLIALGGSGAFAYTHFHKSTPQPEPQEKVAASEGKTFPIPKNVPKDSIKNYQLLKETDHFKIRYDKASNYYIITLYAIINRPDQYDQYKSQLRDYKHEALDYMKQQHININKATIRYDPKEATDL